MSKITDKWHSPRLERDVNIARYGEVGTPVLLFSTAAGDFEEAERFLMIDALAPLLEDCRLKVYCIDSVAGEMWIKDDDTTRTAAWAQERFDGFVSEELIPAIEKDCEADPGDLDVIVAGSSIGAYNALASICRHPEIFSHAICMSGTYDIRKFLRGEITPEFARTSPLHFLPEMPEGQQLEKLRERFVLLSHGQGRWEEPSQSWDTANVLGARGIPNRVDAWGDEYDHDWPTWRAMLPQYLDEFLPPRA